MQGTLPKIVRRLSNSKRVLSSDPSTPVLRRHLPSLALDLQTRRREHSNLGLWRLELAPFRGLFLLELLMRILAFGRKFFVSEDGRAGCQDTCRSALSMSCFWLHLACGAGMDVGLVGLVHRDQLLVGGDRGHRTGRLGGTRRLGQAWVDSSCD